MATLIKQSTAQGVNFELNARGRFQNDWNTYGQDGPHPAHMHFEKSAKYALFEQYDDPITGAVLADSFGSTQIWELKACATYLYWLGLVGEFSGVTTTQAAGNTTTDTIFLKQLAPYVAMNQMKLDIGCNGMALYEMGEEHKLIYDRIYPGERRLYEEAVDGTSIERANWSRRVLPFAVPLLFDCFLLSGGALRVITMERSPPKIEIQFNSAESTYHRTGVANSNNGGATPLLFSPGRMQQVRLLSKYIKLPNQVDAMLRQAAPIRQTFYRQWYRHVVTKANDTAMVTIPIPAIRNTLTALWLCPRNDAYQVTPTTRAGGAGNPESWLLDPHNFWGAITSDGGAEVLREPYAGVDFFIDGQLRYSGDYNKLSCLNSCEYFERSPTLYKERLGVIPFEPRFLRYGPRTGIQLTNQTGIYLLIHFAYGNATTPAWGGRFEVKWQTQSLIHTGNGSASFEY